LNLRREFHLGNPYQDHSTSLFAFFWQTDVSSMPWEFSISTCANRGPVNCMSPPPLSSSRVRSLVGELEPRTNQQRKEQLIWNSARFSIRIFAFFAVARSMILFGKFKRGIARSNSLW
jgi:hypothetical protein